MVTKNVKQLSKEVTDLLNVSGVMIKNKTVQLVLDAYIDIKIKSLSEGVRINEGKAGATFIKFRRGNTFAGVVSPTVKLTISTPPELKNKLIQNIVESEVVQNNVSDRITEEDLDFWKKE